MILAEVPTTLERSELTVRSQRAALMSANAYYSIAPWKYTALMKLHNLEHQHPSQNKSASTFVSSDAAMFARTILDVLQGENVPTPTVCPVSHGSVALIWTVGRKQLEAIFGPDKSGSFVLSNGDEIADDGEITTNNTAPFCKAVEDILAA